MDNEDENSQGVQIGRQSFANLLRGSHGRGCAGRLVQRPYKQSELSSRKGVARPRDGAAARSQSRPLMHSNFSMTSITICLVLVLTVLANKLIQTHAHDRVERKSSAK